jgi:hypothetical protein
VRLSTLVVLAWAAWLTVLSATLLLWTPGDWVEWAPFVAAAGGAWLLGVGLWLRRHRAAGRLAPPYSPGAVLAALGVASIAAGASLGLWLVYVGAGLTIFGLGVVVRETLASRRTGSETL